LDAAPFPAFPEGKTVPLPLSILDLTPIPGDSNSAEAIASSVKLAQLADELGYERYWFAEHHNTTRLASSSPEIMIEHVASRTQNIRVGSGGVMLPNHSALKITETFRLLEALHPGRVDLGLGRAPGTDQLTALAMRRSREALGGDDYPEQLAEMLGFDGDGFPDDNAFKVIKAVPNDVKLPPIWLLGSSGFSAQLAARVGLGFSFAAHINGAGAVPALLAYRERFRPSPRYPEPRAMLTVSVTIGEDAEHARILAKLNDLFILQLRTGQLDRYPTLQEAIDHEFTPLEQAMLAQMPMSYIAGDPPTVKKRIDQLAAQSHADEVMIITMLPELDDRLRMIKTMAHEFALEPRGLVTPFA
jgi:luciferase family oxidoreductase group 1